MTAVASVSEKTEVTVHSVGDKKSAPIKERNDTRLYKGHLNLEVAPPFDWAQPESVQECLARVPSDEACPLPHPISQYFPKPHISSVC